MHKCRWWVLPSCCHQFTLRISSSGFHEIVGWACDVMAVSVPCGVPLDCEAPRHGCQEVLIVLLIEMNRVVVAGVGGGIA